MSAGRDRERVGKIELAGLLVEHAAALHPGRWRLLDTRSAILQTTKLPARASVAQVVAGRGLKSRLLRIRRLMVGPRVVDLDARGHAERLPGSPVRVLKTKGGGLVGFDRAGHSVTHLRREPFASGYDERRRALSEFYGSVDWSLDDDRRTLTEGRVVGVPAADWPAQDRVALLREVLKITTLRLTAPGSEARSESHPLLQGADAGAGTLSGGPRWRALLDAAAGIGAVPWMLSHGDLTPENVLGTGPGDWTPIDFEDARSTPFFYDALSLAVRDDVMRAALLDGSVDDEWRALLEAAGVDHAVLAPEVALDAVALHAATHHRNEHGGDFRYTLDALTRR